MCCTSLSKSKKKEKKKNTFICQQFFTDAGTYQIQEVSISGVHKQNLNSLLIGGVNISCEICFLFCFSP